MDRCPGGELRNLSVTNVTCLRCGKPVEMFSDEQRRKCPYCGHRVTRVSAPPCAAWCDSAPGCLGPQRYKELVESGQIEPRPTRPAEEQS